MARTSTNAWSRGFTLIELLVTIAIVSLVFGGLMTSVQFTMKLINNSKVSTSALALANERIEYIRSLAYADVGTVGGIPNGLIPQKATTTLNEILFHERILVAYVDSEDDGVGGADTNGILADYKEVKVEYSWSTQNGTSSISLLTVVVPQGIESTVGGGTLTVNVFDASVLPVAGAEVHIFNDTTTTTIDTIRYTNAAGVAMFAGAPAAANYQIDVTKLGYSTHKTYSATTSNPNPATPAVAVLESAVSTMNFQIDRLSDLRVRTIGPATTGSFVDLFDDMSNVYSATNTVIIAGEGVLDGGPGAYMATGTILSVPEEPATFTSWDLISWNSIEPASTTLTTHVFGVTGGNTYVLVPDGDLPGNSLGFTGGTINISSLAKGTYPSLALGATLMSDDVNETPSLQDWTIQYVISEPAIGSIPFTLTGNKTIGTTASATPVYKYFENHVTDATGKIDLPDLEWDFYDVVLGTGAYDIREACSGIPYSLNPGVNETLTMTLVPSTTYSLRVSVVGFDGSPIAGADVTLSRSGFTDMEISSTCGQVFFNSGISEQPDYQITVQAAGYVDQVITDINIDGTESLAVTLITL
ncbi:MAG: type II secretion system GspH family protein [Candidatus Pacebacteria bacterium]|nr:type II secretion system GspH family protein [Candidatus Paceibacterota bacterium]MCF7857465.1 type II secretion system GspH family protein [Candidatus Paceibacterota bacterium]